MHYHITIPTFCVHGLMLLNTLKIAFCTKALNQLVNGRGGHFQFTIVFACLRSCLWITDQGVKDDIEHL